MKKEHIKTQKVQIFIVHLKTTYLGLFCKKKILAKIAWVFGKKSLQNIYSVLLNSVPPTLHFWGVFALGGDTIRSLISIFKGSYLVNYWT